MNLVLTSGRGPRGTKIWPTPGAPTTIAGSLNGDYAIDNAAGILYGPKAAGAWPEQGLVIVGNTIRVGSGAPANNLGNDGDIYFDLPGAALYGPRASDAWPTPGRSLIGSPISAVLQASETITAPALVNISSTFGVRNANGASGLPANGYVTTSIANNASGTVYFAGVAAGFSGLTGGLVFLSDAVPGGLTSTPPASGSGHFAQAVGVAISPSSIIFDPGTMNGPI